MALHRPVRRYGGVQVSVEKIPVRLFGTVSESIVDGPGIRYVIFVQGCPHHCPGCHNPGSHDPDGGTLTDTASLWETILKYPHIDGITFSGGEPFSHGAALAEIGRAAREKGLNVMTYSGYTLGYGIVIEYAHSLSACADVPVPFLHGEHEEHTVIGMTIRIVVIGGE